MAHKFHDVIFNLFGHVKFMRESTWEAISVCENDLHAIAAIRNIKTSVNLSPDRHIEPEDLDFIDPTWCTGSRLLVKKFTENKMEISSILSTYIYRTHFGPEVTDCPSDSLNKYFLDCNAKSVMKLIKEFKAEPKLEYIQPACVLIKTFGGRAANVVRTYTKQLQDAAKVENLDNASVSEEISPSKAMHDIGQFSPIKLPGAWAEFFSTRTSLIRRIHRYQVVEDVLGRIPGSVAEFEDAIQEAIKQNLLPNTVHPVFDNMSEEDKETYDEFLEENSAKESCDIPYIETLTNGRFTMNQLAIGDTLALAIGEETDCCQHLNGAGSSCAEVSYTDPKAAVWVVYKNNQVHAQSFVFRTRNTIVIDSIECLGNISKEAIALYKEYAKKLIGNDGIKKILVGDTNYGETLEVIKELNITDKAKHPGDCPSSYSDSKGKDCYVLARMAKEVKEEKAA